MLERKSEFGSSSSTSACWPQFPIMRTSLRRQNGRINTNNAGRNFQCVIRYKNMYDDSSENPDLNANAYLPFLRKYNGSSAQQSARNRASYARKSMTESR